MKENRGKIKVNIAQCVKTYLEEKLPLLSEKNTVKKHVYNNIMKLSAGY